MSWAFIVSGAIVFVIYPYSGGLWELPLWLFSPILPLCLLLPPKERTLNNVIGYSIAAPLYGGMPGFMLAWLIRDAF